MILIPTWVVVVFGVLITGAGCDFPLDGHTVPGVCNYGYVPLSHLGNVDTRIEQNRTVAISSHRRYQYTYRRMQAYRKLNGFFVQSCMIQRKCIRSDLCTDGRAKDSCMKGPSDVKGWHECPEDDKYIGNISVTDSGRLCQRWQDTYPHSHGFVGDDYYFYLDGTIEEADNYCRNTGWDHVWCYTTDPEVRMEYCHERVCGDKNPSCQDGTNLHQYSGTVSVTDGSRTCQRWSEQTPHAHPFNTSDYFPLDDSVEGAVNYCRNVGGDGAPWCFTTDPKVRWQYCYEQICNDTAPSCGGTLTNDSGLIESIDRDNDGYYDDYRDCLWTIIAPDDMVIEVQFIMVDLHPYHDEHFIEIYEDNDKSIMYHNATVPVARFQTNVLHVRIHTEISHGEWEGVKIRYSFVLRGSDESTTVNSTVESTPVTMATESAEVSTPSSAGRQYNRISLEQIMAAVMSGFVWFSKLSVSFD